MAADLGLAPVVKGTPILSVDDLRVFFKVGPRAKQRLRAVDGVSFDILAGETLGLIGESGSGKSTISRAILQLVEPESGTIRFRDRDIGAFARTDRRLVRRHIQMIFQDPHASLDPRMTGWQSVEEPLRVQGLGTTEERRAKALGLLDRVGLSENHARRYPHELSGGQKQRVSIARALTLDPDVLMCDEAVSALDVALQAEILNLLAELQAERGLSYLFITHDLSVVAHIAHRVGVMYLGQLMEVGSVAQIVDDPAHPYTDALLTAQPLPLPSRLRTVERTPLTGDMPSPVSPPSGCRFRTRCPYAQQHCADEVPPWRELSDGHWVACHFAENLDLCGLRSVTRLIDERIGSAPDDADVHTMAGAHAPTIPSPSGPPEQGDPS